MKRILIAVVLTVVLLLGTVSGAETLDFPYCGFTFETPASFNDTVGQIESPSDSIKAAFPRKVTPTSYSVDSEGTVASDDIYTVDRSGSMTLTINKD